MADNTAEGHTLKQVLKMIKCEMLHSGESWGVLAEPPPQLMLSYSNGRVIVSWSRSAAGYLLDQATTLSDSPSAWSRVNASEYQTNATHIYLAVPAPTARTFYRLRRP